MKIFTRTWQEVRMRCGLIELLRTPVTGQALRLEVFKKGKRNLSKGWAHCAYFCSRMNRIISGDEPCDICGQEEVIDGCLISEDGLEQYPVIEGIPRLLPQEYMIEMWDKYPQWLDKYGTAYHSVESHFSPSNTRIQRRTAEQFGREWQTFDKLLKDFNRVFQEYFDLVDLKGFSRKTVLDAGCGMGRWAFHIAARTKRVVAFDLSFAVEPAYRNCYAQGNVEVIQADIFHLPLRSVSFDFIYSLGVLHHLPDPFKGFASLKRLLVENGELLIYVYYDLENRAPYFRSLKRAVDLLRQFTARAPAFCSYPIAFVVAGAVYLPLVWFGDLLQSMGLRDVDQRVPLYQTYSGKSFRLILNDAVDRLTAPVENRYSRDEIGRWFSEAGFRNVKYSDSAPYWKTIGQVYKS